MLVGVHATLQEVVLELDNIFTMSYYEKIAKRMAGAFCQFNSYHTIEYERCIFYHNEVWKLAHRIQP